jgi:hypothetical protein
VLQTSNVALLVESKGIKTIYSHCTCGKEIWKIKFPLFVVKASTEEHEGIPCRKMKDVAGQCKEYASFCYKIDLVQIC